MTPELAAGHIEGFRVWRIVRHRHEPALRSLELPFIWPTGTPMRSWCWTHADRPHIDHECGLWAFRHQSDALELAARYSAAIPRCLFAVGRVAGAGHVIEHQDGWRVQRAAVLELTHHLSGRLTAAHPAGHANVAELVARAAVLYGAAPANA